MFCKQSIQAKFMPKPSIERTGKLIDAWIRLHRMIKKYPKSITDYINVELAEKSELSGRQIERMRRYDGFPEDKSMYKLINAIPDLDSLNYSDFTERLLLPFSVVVEAQNRIKPPPKGQLNTITLISGWIQPLGIEQIAIAKATTKNISQEFEYIFLYPDPQTYPADDIPTSNPEPYATAVINRTEKWVDALRRRCEGINHGELLFQFLWL